MKLYKYVAVRDYNSSYIADMILNNKPSLRATNAFGFADRLEGLVNCSETFIRDTRKMDCQNCVLREDNKCTRSHLCQLCVYSYCCREKGTRICSRGHMNKHLQEDCIDDLSNYELYHRYIFCLSKVEDSNALIEKFCGRLGFILEYDVTDMKKIVEVTYADRPIATPGDKTDLAKLIAKYGHGSDNFEVKKNIQRLIGYKQKEFEYEKEYRIIVSNSDSDEYYYDFTEKDLGIELTKVTLVYDSYMQNLNNDVFDVLDNIGDAILQRGIVFEVNSSTDFVNGNDNNSKHINNRLLNDDAFRHSYLSTLGTSIKNGG